MVLITIMAVLCASFIVADIKAVDARDAYYSYYERIENSGSAVSVIDSCIKDAGANGYEMLVSYVGSEEAPMYKITFKYKFNISLLGVSKTHTIVGYVKA